MTMLSERRLFVIAVVTALAVGSACGPRTNSPGAPSAMPFPGNTSSPATAPITEPVPKASLLIRIGQPSFPEDNQSNLRDALLGLTPITFDASGSIGNVLTY